MAGTVVKGEQYDAHVQDWLAQPSDIFGKVAGVIGGLPSFGISGGAAAPSSASSNADPTIYFNNPFSVAGRGGTASATASQETPSQAMLDSNTMLFFGGVFLVLALVVRRA